MEEKCAEQRLAVDTTEKPAGKPTFDKTQHKKSPISFTKTSFFVKKKFLMDKKHIRFDWAAKKLLRDKKSFDILEGFLSELLKEDIKSKDFWKVRAIKRRKTTNLTELTYTLKIQKANTLSSRYKTRESWTTRCGCFLGLQRQ